MTRRILPVVVTLLVVTMLTVPIDSFAATDPAITGHVFGVGACPSDPCSGIPLFSVRVFLDDATGMRVATKVTRTDGSFAFRVPPGTYEIEARPVAGYASTGAKQIEVMSGQQAPARIRLRLDATSSPGVIGQAIEGPTCPGPQREGEQCSAPTEGATIRVEDESGTTIASQTTGRNGYYAFELASGTYELVADGTGSSWPSPPSPESFTVHANDTGPNHIDRDYDTGIR